MTFDKFAVGSAKAAQTYVFTLFARCQESGQIRDIVWLASDLKFYEAVIEVLDLYDRVGTLWTIMFDYVIEEDKYYGGDKVDIFLLKPFQA